MARYFVQRRAALFVEDDTWVEAMVPSLSVPEHVATDTGLLDDQGDPIMRAPNPVGFGKDEDW